MVYSTRRFVVCLSVCHFVLVFFSPFSIAITSLGEERANLSAFQTFVRFVLVWICRFSLPLGVWEGLRFVSVALPGLFSYLLFLHPYAFPPTILIPSILARIRQSRCRIVLIAPIWPQRPWFPEVLQLISNSSSAPSKITNTSKSKFQHQSLPFLVLHAWELSSNQFKIKKNSQNVADFVSKSRQASTQKVYDANEVVYSL